MSNTEESILFDQNKTPSIFEFLSSESLKHGINILFNQVKTLPRFKFLPSKSHLASNLGHSNTIASMIRFKIVIQSGSICFL